ncbi:serine hydrolase [Chryseobacterium paridis]|uniref:Serine hydrolase n=1 Tax=Chryseobacterium paridis TaxID=2800328 RepID=A0ABS1FUK6_9FLAO|nr:serine hydrolase [Chryseobacterium paridis]MBK1896100.1 serine hydrolase [Chryseobacterium paridis]
MKNHINLIFLFFATFSIFAQLPADSIRAIAKKAVADKRSKSIIIGIIDAEGRTVVREGIISDEHPVLPDENTIYEIGSITKVFTALALAEMSLKNQLNLTDPVSKFLTKGTKLPVKNGKEISLLNLATHRSTLPRFPYNVDPKDLDKPYADYTQKKMFEYLSNFQPDIDIDSKWRYSNTGYGLLGYVLTSVSKRRNYETLIKEEICQPLNMNHTVITMTDDMNKNKATGYTEYGKPTNSVVLSAIEAGGGIRSNLHDMFTFAAVNLGFIKSDLFPAMELTHIKQSKKENHLGYATLGWTFWDDEGQDIVFKDGGTPGFSSFIGIDKKNKRGVIILSNSGNGVTDIGLHILHPEYKMELYRYSWKLLDTLRSTVNIEGVDQAIQLYKKLKTSSTDAEFIFNENQLNYLGHELRRSKRLKDAVKIFELNESEYPKSTLVYESLGEVYKRSHEHKKAIEYFEKARELEPQNPHWSFIISRLKNE